MSHKEIYATPSFCSTVWSLLNSSHCFVIESNYLKGGICDRLEGEIEFLLRSNMTLRTKEHGLWQSKNISGVNNYNWQLESKTIVLSHFRRGVLVPLCRFNDSNNWQDYHDCGEDVYSGALQIEDNLLVLSWSISGPNKSGVLKQTYY